MNFARFAAGLVAIAGVCSIVVLSNGTAEAQQPVGAAVSQPPAAPREFRGAWLPTVYNLGWPSKQGLSSQQQQQEMITLLDSAKSMNLNAIFFQVRPAGDAMYDSKLEPWSEFLTGQQGQPPQPYYDPLSFAIQEAHKRGIQLHAWINPYRVGTKHGVSYAPTSPVNTMPHAAKKLDKLTWLDPAEPQVQAHVLAVVRDIVTRYDVDGVHIDDYFYPYQSEMKNTNGDFPDQDSWQRYQASGGNMDKGDWRRHHVDELMRLTYQTIKEIRPRVYFSTAPFGIWRPGHPEGISGMDAYSTIYGDARKWLREGWQDFAAPQLYWDLSKEKQSFPKLLAWWNEQNVKGRHVWPGISVSGVGSNFPSSDVLKRLQITRDQQKDRSGVIFYAFKPLHIDQGKIATELKAGPFSTPSLVPASPWMDNQPPAPPRSGFSQDPQGGGLVLQWARPAEEDAFLIAIYAMINGQWQFTTVPAISSGYRFPANAQPSAVFVSTVDRTGNESQRVAVGAGAQ